MKTVCERNKCNGCMVCLSVCPKGCIEIRDSIDAFNAIIDEVSCVNCGLCKERCPNVSGVEKHRPIEWKQGWADQEVRSRSSSGGAAAAIMRSFIADGGFVASCLFHAGKFAFEITNDTEFAKKFAGSKYVKSDPAGIYEKVAERLKTHRVLFIGLPCQVAALKKYIPKQDDLYTADLICHGTPSSKLLEKFLHEHGIAIQACEDIRFRSNACMGRAANEVMLNPAGMDDYIMAFLDSVDYTENCYTCQFARFERVSDITLGDSWGSEYKEELANGVSLLLIQSEKGKEMVRSAGMELKDVDIGIAVRDNQQLTQPSALNPERERFLSMIKRGKSFSHAAFVVNKRHVIKRLIKNMLVKSGIRKAERFGIVVQRQS